VFVVQAGEATILYGGSIENRQQRPLSAYAKPIVISEYRYLVHAPLGRSADVPVPDHWPAFDAPIQEPWSLKP